MIAIVAVGYNRVESMKMLVQSICEADYDGDTVDFVISVDKGKNQSEIVKAVETIEWKYGNKIIRAFPEKQGLRKHILQCGDLTEKYDAVVVLEDDLLVSKAFYKYVKNAIGFYDEDRRIGGISLYSYAANEFANKPFTPAYNGYDTFIMQVAQSWGQCWTQRMWQEFRMWEYSDCESLPEGIDVPACVYRWGATSWKKNYMAFLADQQKYFVYPYHSYTTNQTEIGTHNTFVTGDYQVILTKDQREWRFAPFDSAIQYDGYFERIAPELTDRSFVGKKVLFDLYGLRCRYEGADIVISHKRLPYCIISEIGLRYRPIEMNCFYLPQGKGLYVYDLHSPAKAPVKSDNDYLMLEYFCINASWRVALQYAWFGFKRTVKRKTC